MIQKLRDQTQNSEEWKFKKNSLAIQNCFNYVNNTNIH